MSHFPDNMSDLSLPATTYTTMLQNNLELKEACRRKVAETKEEYNQWRLQQPGIPPQAPPVSYTSAFLPEARPPPASTSYTMAYLPETRPSPALAPAPAPAPTPKPAPTLHTMAYLTESWPAQAQAQAPTPAPAPYRVTYVPAPTQSPRVAAPSPMPLSHNHQYVPAAQTGPHRTQEQIQAEREYVECAKRWKESLDILSTAEIQMRAAEAKLAALGVVLDAQALLHQMSSTTT